MNMKHYVGNHSKSAQRHSAEAAPSIKHNFGSGPDATKIYPGKSAKKPRTESVGTPTAPVPPTKAGYLPAFLFAGFILTMTVLFLVLPKQTFSASEKRYLEKFPETSVETVLNGKFGKGFETFFADHFPVRSLWVGVNAYATLAEGNNGANGVYYGKDNYLINKPISTKNELDFNLWILEDFKQIVGDTPVTAMFVPSTGYIMSDKLPLVHDTYNDDQYFSAIAESTQASGIDFIDLREPFKAAAQSGKQLYYRTDHHWTTEGAYTAYLEYCVRNGLQPLGKNRYTLESHEDFRGTTYSTSGFLLTPPETLEVWNNPDNKGDKIKVTITDDGEEPVTTHSMFFNEHDKDADKYPVFLDGNHALTTITNDNVKDGTLLIVKDSFSHCFAPFLADHYHKIIMVDMRLYVHSKTSDLIAAEHPDKILVLYGIDNFAEDMDFANLQ